MTITLNNLTVGYDRHPAVHHISGQFQSASMTAIVGPNGGGKSTLLKALINFIAPLSGSIDFDGILPNEIAYLPQVSDVDPNFPLSVIDVVQLGFWPQTGAFRGLTKIQRQSALEALNHVGLSAYAQRPVAALSIGQWQRVLFARLSLQNAHVLLLDEPFAAIDSQTTEHLMQWIKQWNNEGRTVIAVMHDLTLVHEHFPCSLLLAREVVGWGQTNDILTEDNLSRAQNLSAQWFENAPLCHRDERLPRS